MVKLIKNFVVILTALVVISLISFSGIYGTLCIKKNCTNIEQVCDKIRVDLFDHINLNQTAAATTMPSIDHQLSQLSNSYIGVALSLYNDYLYASPSIESLDFNNFKTVKITNSGLIGLQKTLCQYLFTNSYSGHQLRVVFSPITKQEFILLLKVVTITCAAYLALLIIALIILIFILNNRKENMLIDSQVAQLSDFNFSHSCISKFEEYILNSLNNNSPLTIALIKNFDDRFDESIYSDGFNLIKSHINTNHGYYEFDDNRMILLLPNTPINQGISLIEEFFARLIEENINITINAGVTTLNKRHTTTLTLINEAELALKKASLESENIIFGFNPDPKRYIDFVTKKQLQMNHDAELKIEDYQLPQE